MDYWDPKKLSRGRMVFFPLVGLDLQLGAQQRRRWVSDGSTFLKRNIHILEKKRNIKLTNLF